MHHTIEIVDFTKSVQLNNSQIDNRNGRLTISLKSVDYWVGYYNVRKTDRILRRVMNRDGNTTENYHFIEPGLYNIKQIIDIISLSTPWVELSVNEKTDTIALWPKERKI